MWRRAYGGDPSAVGRTITLNSKPVEIVGVAPAAFHGLEVGRVFDVALPLCAEPAFSSDGKGRADAGTTWWLGVFGRLKPGWTADRASAQLAAASPAVFRASLPATYPPVSVEKYLGFKLAANPGGAGLSQLREAYGSPLWLLLAIAGVVLVIACANLANLLLARASAREREIAVRLGLGASRGRVVRQLLTESLVLVVDWHHARRAPAPGTMGQALVAALETSRQRHHAAAGHGLESARLRRGPRGRDVPALRARAGLARHADGRHAVMRASTRGATASRDSLSLRRALVVVQMALSVALLFGSLLFARTLHNAATVDPGFKPEGLLAAQAEFPRVGFPPEARASYRAEVVDRIRAVPGVQSAAFAAIVPISGDASGNDVWPEGHPGQRFNMLNNSIGPGIFATMGVPLAGGTRLRRTRRPGVDAGGHRRRNVRRQAGRSRRGDRPAVHARSHAERSGEDVRDRRGSSGARATSR